MQRKILFIIIIFFFIFLFSGKVLAADKCVQLYPTGHGSGLCVDNNQCVPHPQWRDNAPVRVAEGSDLCDNTAFVCCVFSDDAPAGSAPTGGQTTVSAPAGRSATDLKSDAGSQLNPASFSAPTDLIKRAINLLFAFIGSISLALYVWAGILWMTAAGEEKRIGTAKSVVVWTSLGVLVMLLSYTLVNFVLTSIK